MSFDSKYQQESSYVNSKWHFDNFEIMNIFFWLKKSFSSWCKIQPVNNLTKFVLIICFEFLIFWTKCCENLILNCRLLFTIISCLIKSYSLLCKIQPVNSPKKPKFNNYLVIWLSILDTILWKFNLQLQITVYNDAYLLYENSFCIVDNYTISFLDIYICQRKFT